MRRYMVIVGRTEEKVGFRMVCRWARLRLNPFLPIIWVGAFIRDKWVGGRNEKEGTAVWGKGGG